MGGGLRAMDVLDAAAEVLDQPPLDQPEVGLSATGQPPRAEIVLAPASPPGEGPRGDEPSEVQAVACLALESALAARTGEPSAASTMVRGLAVAVSARLGLQGTSTVDLELAARVRDVGMLALPDSVVKNEGALGTEDWEHISRHPVLGAELLASIPALAGASEAVRFHHERWDGQGYPDGLKRSDIPLASRIIAVCDAFVALATNRPHRRGIGAQAALGQIIEGRGSQFDPRAVDALVDVLEERFASPGKESGTRRSPPEPASVEAALRRAATGQTGPGRPLAGKASVERQPGGRFATGRRISSDLAGALESLGVIPALAPAHERLLALAGASGATAGEIAAAVEDDVGLTIAVLRRAHPPGSKVAIVTIPEAVSALGADGVGDAVADLPLSEFSWRGSAWETVLQRFRTHAIAVGRAAMKLAAHTPRPDDVLVPALLHDVGKLVFHRAHPDYPGGILGQDRIPEARVLREQRALGFDHPTLGALLLRRWGLPERLARAVGGHHEAETAGEAAWVRLADMLVHHAQGEPVDRNRMLTLSYACSLHPQSLRNALFELPHAGGSTRRRSEPSPLSARETEILRRLANAKRYSEIAEELGISMSTVRSHLHSSYSKLEVEDRAQAVLRATEQGWI